MIRAGNIRRRFKLRGRRARARLLLTRVESVSSITIRIIINMIVIRILILILWDDQFKYYSNSPQEKGGVKFLYKLD